MVVESLEQMLRWSGLPHKIPKDVDFKELIQLMSLDKKIKDGCLRFVVIRKPGDCYLNAQITEQYLHKALVASVEGE